MKKLFDIAVVSVMIIIVIALLAPVAKDVFYYDYLANNMEKELEERGCKNINVVHVGDEYCIRFEDDKFHVYATIDDEIDEITRLVKIDDATGKVAYTYEYVHKDCTNLFKGAN